MSTFATRQHDIWQAVVLSLQAQLATIPPPCDRADAVGYAFKCQAVSLATLAEQAEIILGAIADYHPYDYQYGADWSGNETVWRAAQPGIAQARALAALARIRAELVQWQTLLASKA